MSEKAFLVDTTKCSGCRSCQVACKQWNNLPAEKTEFFAGPELTNPKELSAITWNHVKFFDVDRSNPDRPIWTIMHKKCYHCEVANCLRVCPEKAIYKKDGWTVIDQEKCIGCGACVMNPREIPACAFACPTGALTYDYRLSIVKKAEKRLEEIKKDFPNASIYGRDQFEGLKVITILRDRPEKYGLELKPEPIDLVKAESIRETYKMLAFFSMGIPALKRMAYRMSKSAVEKDRRA